MILQNREKGVNLKRMCYTVIHLDIRKNLNIYKKTQFMERKTVSMIIFISGICLVMIGAGIMFHGNVLPERNSGIAMIIGIFGIGLIGTSGTLWSISMHGDAN